MNDERGMQQGVQILVLLFCFILFFATTCMGAVSGTVLVKLLAAYAAEPASVLST